MFSRVTASAIAFRIDEVVLVGLHKWLHKLSRNQLHLVALCSQRSAQKVGSRARLHPDERGLQVRCERDQLPLSKLLFQQHLAVNAESYKVKERNESACR